MMEACRLANVDLSTYHGFDGDVLASLLNTGHTSTNVDLLSVLFHLHNIAFNEVHVADGAPLWLTGLCEWLAWSLLGH